MIKYLCEQNSFTSSGLAIHADYNLGMHEPRKTIYRCLLKMLNRRRNPKIAEFNVLNEKEEVNIHFEIIIADTCL
jgi:hypothetical protein